jgi:cytochrome c-type biogenesis protein CcmH/NrfG
MMLLMIAAFGIVLWHRFGMARGVFVKMAASAARGDHLASTSGRLWSDDRLPSRRFRMVAAAALLAWSVAAGILAVQSQTVVPPSQTVATPGSPSGAEFYLRRGEDFSSVHDYDRAIADYNTAIRLKPDYAEAYNDRGFAYYLRGDAERAIADYTRAIALRPDYPKAYNSRGVVYMAHGYGGAKAVADFDRAIALKPDFRYAYINRANARLLRHPWLALDDFHRAGMYPDSQVARLGGAILALVASIVLVRRTRVRRDGNWV